MRNWKILKWEEKPEHTKPVAYVCLHCGNDAMLELSGSAMAQVGAGLIFDIGEYSSPEIIECPHCRNRLEAC